MCDHDDEYESLPNGSVQVNMMAGALAGITEHALMYPIDSIKTRMQMQPQHLYTSISNAIARISSAEGALTLWRGVNSMILGAGPAHALSFSVYEHCKETFGEGKSFFGWAAAGACATIAHDGLMTPFDVVKQRLQVESGKKFSGVLSCARHVMRTEGFSAFYISYPTTLAMNVPFHMLHFSTYETAKRALNPKDVYDPLSHCVAGGIAGGTAALLTAPLDTVKTVLQTRGASSDPRVRELRGFADGLRYLWQEHGFFRGVAPRVVTHIPATAISWTTYEFLKMWLKSETTPHTHVDHSKL